MLLVMGGLYFLAIQKHQKREEIRRAAVTLTPGCAEKLNRYGLARGEHYQSPYVLQQIGASIKLRCYSEEDVRAIQRGCNIIDDTQGRLAKGGSGERWNATRFIRGTHASCNQCHQGIGDKQD